MRLQEIGRATFDAAALVREHPPRFSQAHKQRLYDAIPVPIGGTLTVSRWVGDLPDPLESPTDTTVEVVPDHYTYPADTATATHWHVNFADRNLFYAYGSSLMAQDELQTMEHPVLGSVREALVAGVPGPDARGLEPSTRQRDGTPAPVLVRGA